MALTILATQVDAGTIEAATWNAEFNQIYNNPISLISPVTSDITWNDSVKATFGTGGDADIYYDGTNLLINPKVAGSGYLSILGVLEVQGAAPATPVAKTLYEDTIIKGWAKWTTVTTSALDADVNVASLADNGTGITTITWETDFDDEDYAIAIGAGSSADGGAQINTQTAGSCQIIARDNAGAAVDSAFMQIIATGEN